MGKNERKIEAKKGAHENEEVKETEGTYELSTGESVQELPKMTASEGTVVEPSAIFNYSEVQRLNVD